MTCISQYAAAAQDTLIKQQAGKERVNLILSLQRDGVHNAREGMEPEADWFTFILTQVAARGNWKWGKVIDSENELLAMRFLQQGSTS